MSLGTVSNLVRLPRINWHGAWRLPWHRCDGGCIQYGCSPVMWCGASFQWLNTKWVRES